MAYFGRYLRVFSASRKTCTARPRGDPKRGDRVAVIEGKNFPSSGSFLTFFRLRLDRRLDLALDRIQSAFCAYYARRTL
jgi:hypothetical protein